MKLNSQRIALLPAVLVVSLISYGQKLKKADKAAIQQIKTHITYLADDVLFRNFWHNGKLMFCNAVFLVGQE